MQNSPQLQFGDSGIEVSAFQVVLTALGFDVTDADGSFGDSTREAVISFQSSQGLDGNGIVSDSVWDAVASLPFSQPVQLAPEEFPAFARLDAAAGDSVAWLTSLGVDPSVLSGDGNA